MSQKTKNQRVSELTVAKQHGDTEYLIGALSDPELRGIAAMFLGRMHATDAIPQLTRLLSVADPTTRSAAVHALMEIGATDALPELMRMVTTDSSAVVRSHAVGAVRRLGEPALVMPVLLEALGDADGGVSACAAEELGFAGDTTAIEPLKTASGSAHVIRRYFYRRAIRRIRKRHRSDVRRSGLA